MYLGEVEGLRWNSANSGYMKILTHLTGEQLKEHWLNFLNISKVTKQNFIQNIKQFLEYLTQCGIDYYYAEVNASGRILNQDRTGTM